MMQQNIEMSPIRSRLIQAVVGIVCLLAAFPVRHAVAAEAISGTHAGERRIVAVSGVEVPLRWCPPGTFSMGSPSTEDGRYDDESQHRVTLTQGFWMGETEVTQGLWKEVMGENPSYFKSGDDYPLESVSWEECQKFLAKLNVKAPVSGFKWALPTEAQWEYACRAGTKTALPNGRDIKILGDRNAPALDGIAWYGGNSSVGYIDKGRGVDTSSWPGKQYPGGKAGTHPVRSKAANNWGLYDMLGNVWEWCDDWYGEDYYSRSPAADPSGPSSGSARVSRGGSWLNHARYCRPASRAGPDPGYRDPYLGLRVALVPVQ